MELYTDGSHKNGLGSWAYVIVKKGMTTAEVSGVERKTSSLKMEIKAAIEALRGISEGTQATVFSDCRILIDVMTVKNKKTGTSPVADLYDTLFSLAERRKVNWSWVRAHSGVSYNERCDQLCLNARIKRLAK